MAVTYEVLQGFWEKIIEGYISEKIKLTIRLIMKKVTLTVAALLLIVGVTFGQEIKAKKHKIYQNKVVKISKEKLLDKIKGGWAGQTIGVTFGGPYEFRFEGTMIQDYVPLKWYDGYLKDTYENSPGLYDDIYMDLSFVKIFKTKGLDAPAKDFATEFANADYPLWHANQSARYNILHGIDPPKSGYWRNNPHADDIDYQIESDNVGLMSPGMPNAASQVSDKIGHIMNYGDGWYGGVFVGAMYSQAFVSDNIPFIVNQALSTIPEQSEFYQCIHDVIEWHKEFPNDWKKTWFKIQQKWSEVRGGPDGVFTAFDIDAKINSAYVVLGLLYGNGDFTRSLKIATRAGQDADCNPSTVGGILGTVYGYDKVPDYWKQGLQEVENMDFKYTTMSLNDVYQASYQLALQNIKRNNGEVNGENVVVRLQKPKTVRYEESFKGQYPVEKREIWTNLGYGNDGNEHDEYSFNFKGNGFVVMGSANKKDNINNNYEYKLQVYIDGNLDQTVALPTDWHIRRNDIAWKYQLPNKKHHVRLKLLDPQKDYYVSLKHVILYSDHKRDAF
ncbi:MAG TPA: ADP-ribosylglycohydrolase family protein [Balneolaceae bacterium]|nr:ADP-ribosylglycohydrolase family protein [Balneolaceae bacterium]